MQSPNDRDNPAMDVPEPRRGDFIFRKIDPDMPLKVLGVGSDRYSVSLPDGSTRLVFAEDRTERIVRNGEEYKWVISRKGNENEDK